MSRLDAKGRDVAVRRLLKLQESPWLEVGFDSRGRGASVLMEAAALVESCLGPGAPLAKRIEEIPLVPSAFRLGKPSARDLFVGYINAAINLIDSMGDSEPEVSPSCDPDLWNDISALVGAELWDKIPGRVVTFVEHWIRERAGNPPNKKGGASYGDVLMREVLGAGSPLALGGQPNEQKGWADLGSGLMQAIGNKTRHQIHDRDDAERFAWGVIGLGSLLIGELRRQHGVAPSEV